MNKRCEICKEAQKQRGKALSRIRIMENQYSNNKLVINCGVKPTRLRVG